MSGVVPLNSPPTTDSKAPRHSKRRTRQEAAPASFSQDFLPGGDDQTHIDADDGSSHRKNGVQKRIVQKLKRGQFPISDQIDLHQMTTETAYSVLLEFIADAQGTRPECIRIIHGKGLRSKNGPRLKLMTHQLLRDHPQVLAFSICKPGNGGSGAVDVLLKSA